MINIVYKLIAPKQFEEYYEEIDIQDKVIIRPTYLSLCHADQRYFNGKRKPEILKEKLPMSLIHEGIGEVVKDNTFTFDEGDIVTIIPNTPVENDEIIAENYLRSSKFRSSGFDGLMQDLIVSDPDRLVKIPKNVDFKVASFTELISVAVHSISRFNKFSHSSKDIIGIWGDGNLGYITALLLKILLPESKLYIFGIHTEKLSMFSFANETFNTAEIPNDVTIDHAFECVGGEGSSSAINQIIDIINPEGSISLLGVSENPVLINTRMVLEKGINLFGSSRSGRKDFEETINILAENQESISYLKNIINNTVDINSMEDIYRAFEVDYNSSFGKTILKWNK